MIIVTTDEIKGYEIVEVIGLVRGNTIRARAIGKDIIAGFKNMIGGEIHEYTKMIAESREQALDRMVDEAKNKNADAIVCVRFTTSSVMQAAAELFAYGTAVKIKPCPVTSKVNS